MWCGANFAKTRCGRTALRACWKCGTCVFVAGTGNREARTLGCTGGFEGWKVHARRSVPLGKGNMHDDWRCHVTWHLSLWCMARRNYAPDVTGPCGLAAFAWLCCKRVAGEGDDLRSPESVPQESPTRVSHKRGVRASLTRVSHATVTQESALQESPTSVSHKSVPQECPAECPTRVSVPQQNVPPRERPTRASDKSVLHECPKKSFPQECIRVSGLKGTPFAFF